MSEKSSTEDVLKELVKLDTEQAELLKRRNALMKSIEAQLDVVNAEIAYAKEKRGEFLAPAILSRGLEALMTDVEFAAVVYNAHWDNGSGSREVSDALDLLVADVPFMRFSAHTVPDEDNSTALSVPEVAIPRGAAEERIEELAEVLEPLMAVQHKIAEDIGVNVRIDIMEDSLARFGSYRIKADAQSWTVTGWGGDSSSSGSLYEALLHVSENLTYEATAEYEAAMPDWRLEEEADY